MKKLNFTQLSKTQIVRRTIYAALRTISAQQQIEE